jgi:hypothetical protein
VEGHKIVTNIAILLETEHLASVANRGSLDIMILDVAEHKEITVHSYTV